MTCLSHFRLCCFWFVTLGSCHRFFPSCWRGVWIRKTILFFLPRGAFYSCYVELLNLHVMLNFWTCKISIKSYLNQVVQAANEKKMKMEVSHHSKRLPSMFQAKYTKLGIFTQISVILQVWCMDSYKFLSSRCCFASKNKLLLLCERFVVVCSANPCEGNLTAICIIYINLRKHVKKENRLKSKTQKTRDILLASKISQTSLSTRDAGGTLRWLRGHEMLWCPSAESVRDGRAQHVHESCLLVPLHYL